jgi:hypothetical protein
MYCDVFINNENDVSFIGNNKEKQPYYKPELFKLELNNVTKGGTVPNVESNGGVYS